MYNVLITTTYISGTGIAIHTVVAQFENMGAAKKAAEAVNKNKDKEFAVSQKALELF